METPILFLAPSSASLAGCPGRNTAHEDMLLFEPGFLALTILCQVLADRPAAERTALQFIDGPLNPELDEGVQLFRITDDVVHLLSRQASHPGDDVLPCWLEELGAYGQATPPMTPLTNALAQLAQVARHGERSSRGLFVKVLFR